MKIQDFVRLGRKILLKRNIMPEYLTYFVTNQCNLRCQHCFLENELADSEDELNLSEIKKISKNMGRFFFLNLTGGEPYLRQDLPEIVGIFFKNNHIETVTIPTNGLLTEEIVTSVEKILTGCKDLQFSVDIAIDEIGQKHDKIRGKEGVFKKAVETFNQLKQFKKRYDNLNLGINITYSGLNQKNIREIYKYIYENLKPDTITLLLIRGNPRNEEAKVIDINYYREIDKIEKKYFAYKKGWGGNNFLFSLFNLPFNNLRRQIILNTLQTEKRQLNCYAGKLSVVLCSNGDLYPCELLNMKIGNLREADYNLKKLLLSDEAERIRNHIKKNNCYCTHECSLTANILFNPLQLTKLLTR